MDSIAVHNIVATDLYMIKKGNITAVYGEDIIREIEYARMCPDSIIKLNPKYFYSYEGNGDTLMLKGQQILDAFPLVNCQPYLPVMGWGALMFGVVIGWNLYFVNRYRKRDNIGFADLTSIIVAITGGALLTFLDNSQRLIGWYGIGLAVGFMLYFLVLVLLSKKAIDSAYIFPDFFLKVHADQTPSKVKPGDENLSKP